MRKITPILILSVVLVILLSGCGGGGSVQDDAKAILKINSALVFPFDEQGAPAGFCQSVEMPPEELGGISFEAFEAGGGTVYSPLEKVSAETYESILEEIEGIYGPPSYESGLSSLWVAENSDFELTVVFNPDIHNQMAIGIK